MQELGESLVARGHTVTVLAPMPSWRYVDQNRNDYRTKFYDRRIEAGMQVIRVRALLTLRTDSCLAKGMDHISRSLAQLIGGFTAGPQDVILVYSPPIFSGLVAWLLGLLKRAPYVLMAQDLFPQYAIDLGILRDPFIISLFRVVERIAYKSARFVVVHSEGNRRFLKPYVNNDSKLVVLHNWTDTEKIRPASSANEFRNYVGSDNVFVVSYAGTIGWAQDLDTVLDAAALLRSDHNIRFLLVGDGLEKAEMQKKAESLQLDNVVFLPLQPIEKYPLVLAASDACLVNLKCKLTTPVVPSKLLNIMASGRPVVGTMPLEGDAPELIEAAECGICVPPGDSIGLTNAILKLKNDPDLAKRLGGNGRRYAEVYFSRQRCVLAYEELLCKLAF